MSPIDQQEALAHADGWRVAFPAAGKPHPRTNEGGILLPYRWVNERTGKRLYDLPDYLNDFNALHSLIKTLTPYPQIWMMDRLLGDSSEVWLCEPPQIAEAILRVLKLWTGGDTEMVS